MSRIFEYYMDCDKESKIEFLKSYISDLEAHKDETSRIAYYKAELEAVETTGSEITISGYTFAKESPLEPVGHGLVDYVAVGYILISGEKIPCEIGYTDFGDSIKPTYLFTQDGYTENGNHYDLQTIEL